MQTVELCRKYCDNKFKRGTPCIKFEKVCCTKTCIRLGVQDQDDDIYQNGYGDKSYGIAGKNWGQCIPEVYQAPESMCKHLTACKNKPVAETVMKLPNPAMRNVHAAVEAKVPAAAEAKAP